MATTPVSQALARGGAFLVSSTSPEDVFTPADLTDDQRLLGRTIEEFLAKEVIPHIPELEKHKEGLMPELIRKAGEVGLLGAGIPEEYGGAALDKISMTIVSEKLSAYPSFMVSFGAHTGIGTHSHHLFRHRGAKEEIPAQNRRRRIALLLCALRAASGIGRARRAHARRAFAGRQELAPHRPEDVDHQRRVFGHLCRIRESPEISSHPSSSSAGRPAFPWALKKTRWESEAARPFLCFSRTPPFPRKTCCTTSAAATSSPSIRSTRAAFRSAPAARGEPRTYWRSPRNTRKNAPPSESRLPSSA